MKRLAIIAALVCSAAYAEAPPIPSRNSHEAEWSEYIAARWESPTTRTFAEYRLEDGSRADLYEVITVGPLVTTNVYEVDRAYKWKESIGQAAFYQSMSGAKTGGVILICLDGEADHLFVLRCAIACARCNLKLWLIEPSGAITLFPTDDPPELGKLLVSLKQR